MKFYLTEEINFLFITFLGCVVVVPLIYWRIFLNSIEDFPTLLASISKLLNLFQENNNIEIYPSHEEYAVGKELLINLSNGIDNIENIWDTKVRDDFTEGWLLSDETFKYLVFWIFYNKIHWLYQSISEIEGD